MTKATIMIVEDKFIVAQDIAMSLKKLGYTICSIVSSGQEAIQAAKDFCPDLALVDIRIQGDMDGIATATELRSFLDLAIVYLTAHSDSDTLERACLTYPEGYLLKPYDDRQLYTTIELALNKKGAKERMRSLSIVQQQEQAAPEKTSQKKDAFANFIGCHPTMLRLFHEIELVAMTDVSVHIHGENGTGKELVADAMTKLGARADKPFLKLNCSAIPTTLFESALFGHTKGAFTGANKDQEGFIERAEGGTLFLDEIGDISLDMQVKLLRVLQSGEFSRVGETTIRKADIRIVTATNRNLKELVSQGKIREDFYYRINVFPLTVPSLRERGEDVLLVAEHYRILFNAVFSKQVASFSEEAKRLFLTYQWPGNVRELENILKRAFVLVQGDSIGLEHLPTEITQATKAAAMPITHDSWGSVANPDVLSEREKILAALRQAGGNKGQAAHLLGMSRVTLWKKMVKLELNQPDDEFGSSLDDSKDAMTA